MVHFEQFKLAKDLAVSLQSLSRHRPGVLPLEEKDGPALRALADIFLELAEAKFYLGQDRDGKTLLLEKD